MAAGIALLGAGCFGPGEPEFVDYTATLQSPNGSEGAAVIEVAGSGITGIDSGADQFYTGPPGPTTRLVLVLASPGMISFTLTADKREDPPTATVVAVADGANQPRSDLTGYAVNIQRVGGR